MIPCGEGNGAFLAKNSQIFRSTGAGNNKTFLPATVLSNTRDFFAKTRHSVLSIKPGEGNGAFFAEKSRKFLNTGAGNEKICLPPPVLRKIREFFAKNAPFPSPGLMKIENSFKCASPRTRICIKPTFPLSWQRAKRFFMQIRLGEK